MRRADGHELEGRLARPDVAGARSSCGLGPRSVEPSRRGRIAALEVASYGSRVGSSPSTGFTRIGGPRTTLDGRGSHHPAARCEESWRGPAAQNRSSRGCGGRTGCPLGDSTDRPVRVISQTDLVRLRGSSLSWTGWHGLLVRDLMTRPARTIAATAPLDEAARQMTDERVHRLVVVDDRQTPIGVISESDIVREIADCCDDG